MILAKYFGEKTLVYLKHMSQSMTVHFSGTFLSFVYYFSKENISNLHFFLCQTNLKHRKSPCYHIIN